MLVEHKEQIDIGNGQGVAASHGTPEEDEAYKRAAFAAAFGDDISEIGSNVCWDREVFHGVG